ALYKLQHTDKLPGAGSGTTWVSSSQFWTDMTTQTDGNGAAFVAGAASGPYGPYMQSVAINPLNNASTVLDDIALPGSTAGGSCAYVYDFDKSATPGTGRLYATGLDATTVLTGQ
ncbi:MAG TPA: hypothetical protein VGI81_03855, partial [Tepidisphaeraceae bacterium]